MSEVKASTDPGPLLTRNPVGYLFAAMWRYSKGNQLIVALFWLMFAVGGIIAIALEPYFIAQILDHVQKKGVSESDIPFIAKNLCGIVAVAIGFWCFHGPARVMEIANAFLVRRNHREFFVGGVLSMPMKWHNENHSGEIIDRMEKGSSSLHGFAGDTFDVLYVVARLIVTYVVLIHYNFVAGCIATVFLGISIWVTVRFDRLLKDRYSQMSKAENKTARDVHDTVTNVATVITHRVQHRVFGRIMCGMDEQANITRTTARLDETKWFIISVLGASMLAAILGFYFWNAIEHKEAIAFGSLFSLYTYTHGLTDIFYRFSGSYSRIVKYRTRAKNAEEVAKEFPTQIEKSGRLPESWTTIRISGLSFQYSLDGPKVLHNMTMDIQRGEKIALVGASGSGKSTLLSLLRGLYDPTYGVVFVDGNVWPSGLKGFGESVGFMRQTSQILDGTIRYNLTLDAEYTEKQIAEAIAMARFDTVVQRLSKGLESKVFEQGVNLSGGECQRLALARSILASLGRQIVLLDEPTSSLDPVTEKLALNGIMSRFDAETIICSTHRFDILPIFDKIIVVKDGKILDCGTYDELVQRSTEFIRLKNAPQIDTLCA